MDNPVDNPFSGPRRQTFEGLFFPQRDAFPHRLTSGRSLDRLTGQPLLHAQREEITVRRRGGVPLAGSRCSGRSAGRPSSPRI